MTGSWPSPWLVLFINHTGMLALSLIIMLVASKGRLSRYGFRPPKGGNLAQATLWGLGLGIISTLIEAMVPGKESSVTGEMSFLQVVVFIWLYASISEEVFVRGLIQSSLSRLTKYGFTILGRRITFPVLASALLFGLLHLAQAEQFLYPVTSLAQESRTPKTKSSPSFRCPAHLVLLTSRGDWSPDQ